MRFPEKARALVSNQRFQTFSVWILRIVVGAVFIYSGFVKAVDPWGFIFKLEEYFALADVTLPRSITLLLSLSCSIYEFVAGLVLLVGNYRRLAPVSMLLFMLVMLPLTAYLYIKNPIPDCGCFGDAIILSNKATFLKNVFLTAAIVFLLFYNKDVKGLFSRRIGWAVAGLGFLYSLSIGIYGYNVQPVIDFRPYPEGTDLNAGDAEEEEVAFIYEKNGERKRFDIDNLPEDDSWEFVERIESGSDDHNGYLSLNNGDMEDVLPEILEENQERGFFLLVVAEPVRADISGTYYVNELASICRENGIGFYGAIATDKRGVEAWMDLSLADYPVFMAEDTSLKELVRGTMALVYVSNGRIIWKRTASTLTSERLDDIAAYASENKSLESLLESRKVIQGGLIRYTLIYIGILLLLLVAEKVFLAVRKRKMKQG